GMQQASPPNSPLSTPPCTNSGVTPVALHPGRRLTRGRRFFGGLEEKLFAHGERDLLAPQPGEEPLADLVAGQGLRLDVLGVEGALPDLADVGDVDEPDVRLAAPRLRDLG